MAIDIECYLMALQKSPLFADFEQEELKQLLNLIKYKIKKYDKDQIIHLKNEICQAMDIILSGRVTVQNIEENGNILTINEFAAGDIIAANLIFSTKNSYPMTVTASCQTIILHVQKESVLRLCHSSQIFMMALFQEISNKTLIFSSKINSISLKTIRQNIIEFIKDEYRVQNNTVIKLDMTKKDLAERMGIQRPSLSRELHKMRQEGLLTFDTHTITILDKKMIE
jgi:CRP-like cAMP-binding protein